MALIISATLAAAGCHSESTGCPPGPEGDPFTLDVELDEATVDGLLDQFEKSEPGQLACDDVCHELYQRDSELLLTQVDACSLEFDGEAMGDPAAILGTLHCEGYASGTVCVGGRRPLGHVELLLADGGLATYLAHCARLEAASVVAFEQLAARLGGWGAPDSLVERCRQAAVEESMHAEMLGELARRGGADVERATQREVPVDLACAALDNALEGCVNEAWAALACGAAARRAETPELRAVYGRLAGDEANHAQLAWDLHTWFMGQVTVAQRAEIVAAQRAALAELPGLARAQQRRTPRALAFPGVRAAVHFAASLGAG